MMKSVKAEIHTHFRERMSEPIAVLADQALWDLLYGPGVDDPEYPGFTPATEILREWADDNLGDVWANTVTGEWQCGEPGDELGDGADDYYQVDLSEWVLLSPDFVKTIVFDRLSTHI